MHTVCFNCQELITCSRMEIDQDLAPGAMVGHTTMHTPGSDAHTWVRGPQSLQGRHTGRSSVSNHQPHDCLLNQLFRRRSKKTSKLRITGLCVGNSPGTGEFPTQMANNAENVSIWRRHHVVHGGMANHGTWYQTLANSFSKTYVMIHSGSI